MASAPNHQYICQQALHLFPDEFFHTFTRRRRASPASGACAFRPAFAGLQFRFVWRNFAPIAEGGLQMSREVIGLRIGLCRQRAEGHANG
jgi:hypothetical protein